VRLQISVDGNNVPVGQRNVLNESLFLHDLALRRGKAGALIAVLNERLKQNEIVLSVTPPANPKARVIHTQRPDLTKDDIRILDKLGGEQRAAISFEATVTDTGQVIDVRPISGIPQRAPREIVEKLRDAAMRYNFEPYVLDGKAAAFTTTIVLEAP